MFLAYCPRHDSDVLLGYRAIRDLVNVAPGVIVLQAECYDGTPVQVVTGARAAEFRHTPGADAQRPPARDGSPPAREIAADPTVTDVPTA